MREDNGAIAIFESDEDAKKAGHNIPITHKEAKHLGQKPRGDRCRELKRLRKKRQKAQRKARKAQRK